MLYCKLCQKAIRFGEKENIYMDYADGKFLCANCQKNLKNVEIRDDHR